MSVSCRRKEISIDKSRTLQAAPEGEIIANRLFRLALVCSALACSREGRDAAVSSRPGPAAAAIAPSTAESSRPRPEPVLRLPVDSLEEVPAPLRVAGDAGRCHVPTRRVVGLEAAQWVLELPNGAGYAAWCRRANSPESRYDILVAVTLPTHPWAECPVIIPVNQAETFSVFRVLILSNSKEGPYPAALSQFDRFDSAGIGAAVADSGVASGPVLDFGEGDAGNMLYCYHRQWVMAGYH